MGLDPTDKFRTPIKYQIDRRDIVIGGGKGENNNNIRNLEVDEDDEFDTDDTVIYGCMKEIVRDIEYGVVSGIFEFTILNDDAEKSL